LAIDRNLQPELWQRTRRQRDRRLRLPMDRRLVEGRPGKEPRYPRHHRHLEQRRLRLRLFARRKQYERGVVWYYRARYARRARALSRTPARRLLRPATGLLAESLRDLHE